MVAGEFVLDQPQGATPGIVLGRKLASRLGVDVGDKVVVFGIGRVLEGGQGRVMAFRVTGVYESGMAEYDDVYAYAPLREAQILFQIPDAVSGYDIQLSRADSAEVIAERISDMLGYPHFARTVYESYRNLFSWIELQKKPIPIILGLIIIVATVNIIGTLLMMVLDKTRESRGSGRTGRNPMGDHTDLPAAGTHDRTLRNGTREYPGIHGVVRTTGVPHPLTAERYLLHDIRAGAHAMGGFCDRVRDHHRAVPAECTPPGSPCIAPSPGLRHQVRLNVPRTVHSGPTCAFETADPLHQHHHARLGDRYHRGRCRS